MAETHTYLKTHKISGTGMVDDLLDEGVDLLETARASVSGRAAKTLVKNGPLRVTLVAMTKGTAARKHHVDGPATIQVLRGRLRVTTPRGAQDVNSGSLFILSGGVAHSHSALSDCVAVLTVVSG